MAKSSLLTTRVLRWLAWRLSIPLLLLNGWCLLILLQYFRTPISLLVVGALLAFLLQYPLRGLEHLGMKRSLAILVVLLGALLVVTVLGITLIPELIRQADQLARSLTNWQRTAEPQIQALHTWATNRGIPININGAVPALTARISSQAQALAAKVPEFILSTFGGVFELVLTIIITIYLLVKGEQLWNGILEWLPAKFSTSIRKHLPRSFQNYFIGQGTVALLLGAAMILAFLLFRIPFGVLFGAFIGVMAIFPYGGTVAIVLVAILVALKSLTLGIRMLLVAILVDQMIENGIAPRFLGELTGVHPVWVILVLIIGGKVAGVLGFILAVPLASFVKSMMTDYKQKYPLALVEKR
jgi:predicted PurR-regulated permease PerM